MWQAEHLALGDRHDPQLTGPVIDVTEDAPVERLQMSQVVAAGKAPPFQVDQPGGGQRGLHLRQLVGVGDAQQVTQHSRRRIQVWVRADRAAHLR